MGKGIVGCLFSPFLKDDFNCALVKLKVLTVADSKKIHITQTPHTID